MPNCYPTLGGEHMISRDGIICLHLSFEFIECFLEDTDLDHLDIHPSSKVRLQEPGDACISNGNHKSDHTSLKSASTLSMAPSHSGVASDAAQCHYRYPLLMVL